MSTNDGNGNFSTTSQAYKCSTEHVRLKDNTCGVYKTTPDDTNDSCLFYYNPIPPPPIIQKKKKISKFIKKIQIQKYKI